MTLTVLVVIDIVINLVLIAQQARVDSLVRHVVLIETAAHRQAVDVAALKKLLADQLAAEAK